MTQENAQVAKVKEKNAHKDHIEPNNKYWITWKQIQLQYQCRKCSQRQKRNPNQKQNLNQKQKQKENYKSGMWMHMHPDVQAMKKKSVKAASLTI